MPAIPSPDFPKLPKPDSVYEFKLTLDQVVMIEVALERLEAGIHINLPAMELKQQAHEEINKLMILRGNIQNQLNRQTFKEMWGMYPEEDKR